MPAAFDEEQLLVTCVQYEWTRINEMCSKHQGVEEMCSVKLKKKLLHTYRTLQTVCGPKPLVPTRHALLNGLHRVVMIASA